MKNLKMRGELTIVSTDTLTGEKTTVSDINVATGLRGWDSTSSGMRPNGFDMYISSIETGKGNPCLMTRSGGVKQTSRQSYTRSTATSLSEGDDIFFQRVFRFDAHPTDSDINTIYLEQSGIVKSYISLDTTFVKSANAALDITYRLLFDTSSMVKPDLLNTYRWLYGSLVATSANYSETFYSSSPVDTTSNSGTGFIGLHTERQQVVTGISGRKIKIDKSLVKTDNTGYVLKSIIATVQGFGIGRIPVIDGSKSLKPTPNYPLGPLFNHSVTGTAWYEQLTKLATGLGYPVIEPSSTVTYANTISENDLHIIRITKGGNTGTARYDMIVRPITGDVSSKGNPRSLQRQNIIPAFSVADFGTTRDIHKNGSYPVPLSNATGSDDASLIHNTKSYNGDKYYHFGIVNGDITKPYIYIRSLANAEYCKVFDAGTTPALSTDNGTSIQYRHIDRNGDGDLFYARATGITIIKDPLSETPSVTHISNGTMGITAVPKAIAGNTLGGIFVLADDGIVYSNDGGSTWSKHTKDLTSYSYMIPSNNNSNEFVIFGTDRKGSWLDGSTGTITTVATNVIGYTDYLFMPIVNDPVTNIWSILSSSQANSGTTTLSVLNFGETSATLTINTLYDMNIYYDNFGIPPIHAYDGLGNFLVISRRNSGVADDLSIVTTLENNLVGGSSISSGSSYILSEPGRYSFLYDMIDGMDTDGLSYGNGFQYVRKNTCLIEHQPLNNQACAKANGDHYMADDLVNNKNYHRWDTDTNTWKANWNKDASPTADSGNTTKAKRLNFETDQNRFNANCSLELTDTIAGADFSTNGFTLALIRNREDKVVPAFSSTWDNVPCTEVPTSCLFELHESTGNKSIALMEISNTNAVMLYDRTDSATHTNVTLETLQASGVDGRYVLTLNSAGTIVKVFRDGVQLGSDITLQSSMNMNGTYNLNVGSRNRADTFDVKYLGSTYKGELKNIQVFSKAWTPAEVTTDAATPSGLIGTTDLINRYLMDEDYGEGKVTSATMSSTPYGMDVSFPDGDLSADSYVQDEWYASFKCKDGIVKDNATSFTIRGTMQMHTKSLDVCTSATTGLSVIPATTNQITEPVQMAVERHNDIQSIITHCKGHVRANIDYKGLTVFQAGVDSDLSFEWTETLNSGGYTVRCVRGSDSGSYTAGYNVVMAKPGIGIIRDDTASVDTPFVWGAKDRFKITFTYATGECKTFHYNTGTTSWDQVGPTTSITTYPGDTMVIQLSSRNTFHSAYITSSNNKFYLQDMLITYTPPVGLMYIGDKGLSTGVYDDTFDKGFTQGSVDNPSQRVFIDGVEVTAYHIVSSTTSTDSMYLRSVNADPSKAPAPGEVTITPWTGALLFNPVDAGKTVTVESAIVRFTGV